MGHFSFETRDSRSLSCINAALKERDVICQLPPYSFRFPQEQYTTGSNMRVRLKIYGGSYIKVAFTLRVLLCPPEMEGISLIVMQYLHLMVGEAEEIAEVKEKDQQGV